MSHLPPQLPKKYEEQIFWNPIVLFKWHRLPVCIKMFVGNKISIAWSQGLLGKDFPLNPIEIEIQTGCDAVLFTIDFSLKNWYEELLESIALACPDKTNVDVITPKRLGYICLQDVKDYDALIEASIKQEKFTLNTRISTLQQYTPPVPFMTAAATLPVNMVENTLSSLKLATRDVVDKVIDRTTKKLIEAEHENKNWHKKMKKMMDPVAAIQYIQNTIYHTEYVTVNQLRLLGVPTVDAFLRKCAINLQVAAAKTWQMFRKQETVAVELLRKMFIKFFNVLEFENWLSLYAKAKVDFQSVFNTDGKMKASIALPASSMDLSTSTMSELMSKKYHETRRPTQHSSYIGHCHSHNHSKWYYIHKAEKERMGVRMEDNFGARLYNNRHRNIGTQFWTSTVNSGTEIYIDLSEHNIMKKKCKNFVVQCFIPQKNIKEGLCVYQVLVADPSETKKVFLTVPAHLKVKKFIIKLYGTDEKNKVRRVNRWKLKIRHPKKNTSLDTSNFASRNSGNFVSASELKASGVSAVTSYSFINRDTGFFIYPATIGEFSQFTRLKAPSTRQQIPMGANLRLPFYNKLLLEDGEILPSSVQAERELRKHITKMEKHLKAQSLNASSSSSSSSLLPPISSEPVKPRTKLRKAVRTNNDSLFVHPKRTIIISKDETASTAWKERLIKILTNEREKDYSPYTDDNNGPVYLNTTDAKFRGGDGKIRLTAISAAQKVNDVDVFESEQAYQNFLALTEAEKKKYRGHERAILMLERVTLPSQFENQVLEKDDIWYAPDDIIEYLDSLNNLEKIIYTEINFIESPPEQQASSSSGASSSSSSTGSDLMINARLTSGPNALTDRVVKPLDLIDAIHSFKKGVGKTVQLRTPLYKMFKKAIQSAAAQRISFYIATRPASLRDDGKHINMLTSDVGVHPRKKAVYFFYTPLQDNMRTVLEKVCEQQILPSYSSFETTLRSAGWNSSLPSNSDDVGSAQTGKDMYTFIVSVFPFSTQYKVTNIASTDTLMELRTKVWNAIKKDYSNITKYQEFDGAKCLNLHDVDGDNILHDDDDEDVRSVGDLFPDKTKTYQITADVSKLVIIVLPQRNKKLFSVLPSGTSAIGYARTFPVQDIVPNKKESNGNVEVFMANPKPVLVIVEDGVDGSRIGEAPYKPGMKISDVVGESTKMKQAFGADIYTSVVVYPGAVFYETSSTLVISTPAFNTEATIGARVGSHSRCPPERCYDDAENKASQQLSDPNSLWKTKFIGTSPSFIYLEYPDAFLQQQGSRWDGELMYSRHTLIPIPIKLLRNEGKVIPVPLGNANPQKSTNAKGEQVISLDLYDQQQKIAMLKLVERSIEDFGSFWHIYGLTMGESVWMCGALIDPERDDEYRTIPGFKLPNLLTIPEDTKLQLISYKIFVDTTKRPYQIIPEPHDRLQMVIARDFSSSTRLAPFIPYDVFDSMIARISVK